MGYCMSIDKLNKNKRILLFLCVTYNMQRWTPQEIKYLTELVGNKQKTIKEISKIMNRTESSLYQKTRKLKLRTSKSQLMYEQRCFKKQGKRRCWKCQKILPYKMPIFRPGRRQCIKCERKMALKNHRERMKNLTLKDAIRYKLYQAKYRSKNKRQFNLKQEDLIKLWEKQKGRCYYSGLPMVIKQNEYNYISIDRYDSNKGYTIDNIVLCCHIINLMKKDMPEKIFISYCQAIVAHKFP